MKDELVKQIPALGAKYKKFRDYREQTIEDIFPKDVLKQAVVLKARVLQSCVMINKGGKFQWRPLPLEAQFSPVFAVLADDLDHDGLCELLLGGNQYRAKPETGIYAASYGLYLKAKRSGGWSVVPAVKSGFSLTGEMRDLKILRINQQQMIAVVRNNDKLQFYKMNKGL